MYFTDCWQYNNTDKDYLSCPCPASPVLSYSISSSSLTPVILLLFTMNILATFTIALTISSYLVLADESFHGSGTFACYGDMSITFDKSGSGGEGEGFLDCQPSWGSPAAPPQVSNYISGLQTSEGPSMVLYFHPYQVRCTEETCCESSFLRLSSF